MKIDLYTIQVGNMKEIGVLARLFMYLIEIWIKKNLEQSDTNNTVLSRCIEIYQLTLK